jgi:hypothetical protein
MHYLSLSLILALSSAEILYAERNLEKCLLKSWLLLAIQFHLRCHLLYPLFFFPQTRRPRVAMILKDIFPDFSPQKEGSVRIIDSDNNNIFIRFGLTLLLISLQKNTHTHKREKVISIHYTSNDSNRQNKIWFQVKVRLRLRICAM